MLGRASAALQGLIVVPGVIDSDYTGRIKILVRSPNGTLVINEGDKIAQLLLLPSLHGKFPSQQRIRGGRGPGAGSGIFEGLHLTLDKRPMLSLRINGRKITGLLDTGADRSIISKKDWPSSWPTNTADNTLQGLGMVTAPQVSAITLPWCDEEGHQGHFQPFVLQLPVSLWGRDILTQMDVTLTSNCSPQAKGMLKNQGYIPGKGLGSALQGQTSPVPMEKKEGRHGLGFF